jgi:RNA-directed DNA polymerase
MRVEEAEDHVEKRDTSAGGSGRKPQGTGAGAKNRAASKVQTCQSEPGLMEAVVGRENMRSALRRVEGNRGSAGVDGMTAEELRPYLFKSWSGIREELLGDRYQPQPVRRVEIPKPGGKGMRQLGIPVVVDRLIQQALLQILQPLFEPNFSRFSYGFRPDRSAQQAVQQARAYVAEGRRWVVDIDLEKFFDRVNHDVLMSRVCRVVKDRRVLRLIRRYLQAGILVDGLVESRTEGTPQGGPLSPLLSNILLDDLDRELERRGHRFCRYADDCNIYVQTKRAGERVMDSIERFLGKRLKLKLNHEKSAVARPWERKFLGYSITWHWESKLRISPESIRRLKQKLLSIFKSGRGQAINRLIREKLTPLLRGWINYFRLTEIKGVLEELDGWLRRHLRCILWRQWKRSCTRARNLMRAGLTEETAWRSATNGRGPWWNSGAQHMNLAFPKKFFDALGLVSLLHLQRKFAIIS